MTPVARELTQGANVLSRPKFHQMKGLAVSVLNTHMMGDIPIRFGTISSLQTMDVGLVTLDTAKIEFFSKVC